MKWTLAPSQDVNIRISEVEGTLAGLDDQNKVWTVKAELSVEFPDWNKDSEGAVVDSSIRVQTGRFRRMNKVIAMIEVTRDEIAAAAGLGAPEDVPAMPAGEMETAIIGVAVAKIQNTFGVTIPTS